MNDRGLAELCRLRDRRDRRRRRCRPRRLQSDIAADVPVQSSAGAYVVLAKGGFNRPTSRVSQWHHVELYRVTGASEVSRATSPFPARSHGWSCRRNLRDRSAAQVRETIRVSQQMSCCSLCTNTGRYAVGRDQLPSRFRADWPVARSPADRAGAPASAMGRPSRSRPLWSRRTRLASARANWKSRRRLTTLSVRSQRHSARQCRARLARRVGLPDPGRRRCSVHFQRFELKQLPLTYRAASERNRCRGGTHRAGRRRRLDGAADDVTAPRRTSAPLRSPPTSRAANSRVRRRRERCASAERRQQRPRRLSQGSRRPTATSHPTS